MAMIFPDPIDDPSFEMPQSAMLDATRALAAALPAPAGETRGQKTRRERAAVEAVAGLVPTDAAQIRLAVQFVIADAQALRCIEQADALTPETGEKLRARAVSLMRESKSALRLLLRLQEVVAKREAAGKAGLADWVRHTVGNTMMELLRAEKDDPTDRDEFSPDETRDEIVALLPPVASAETIRPAARLEPVLAHSSYDHEPFPGSPGRTGPHRR